MCTILLEQPARLQAMLYSCATYTFLQLCRVCTLCVTHTAGLVVTFNDFQVAGRHTTSCHSFFLGTHALSSSSYVRQISRCGRPRVTDCFLISLLTKETLIYVIQVVMIEDRRSWSAMNTTQLSTPAFWNLIFVRLIVCRSIAMQTVADRVSDGVGGSFCFGDSFTYGRLWMDRTHQRTWCNA